MESGKDEFMEGVIWYDSLCVSQDPESNIKEYDWNTTTDIEYICDCIDPAHPELLPNISDDGFVLWLVMMTGVCKFIRLIVMGAIFISTVI